MTRRAPPVAEFVPASRLAASEGAAFRTGPAAAGVYLFRDGLGEVVYVGKSRHLRRRVLDHLHLRVEKDGSIVAESRSVEFVPTVSEREALLLEGNLIKQYQPKYNVLWKDDRSFPYLGVTVGEQYPRVLLLRRPRRGPGTTLFGPYTNVREARSLQKLLTETFQLRQCIRLPKRACIYFHMKTCSAPCIGAIDQDGYDRDVLRALRVLKGEVAEVRPSVEREMTIAAQRGDFERAAVLRDALGGLGALHERQHVIGPGVGRVDVLAVALPRDATMLRVAVGVLHVVDGEVRGTDPHLLVVPANDLPDASELLRHFLVPYYTAGTELPARIVVLGPRPAGLDDVVTWLESDRGITVKFRPTGRWASLARLAERQARAHLDGAPATGVARSVLEALQSVLQLPTLPRRIEGTDISLIQGTDAVGSLVVFRMGRPAKDEYRRFRIKGVPGSNDPAMIAEVVRRRFSRQLAEGEMLPDLLLIDGGRTQVDAAAKEIEALHLTDRLPIVGLAKREEELYFPDRPEPTTPDPNSAPMLLLRAVRDEAHRFAITYHRRRRSMRLRGEVERAISGTEPVHDDPVAPPSPDAPELRPASELLPTPRTRRARARRA
ncbi:MAG: excinuclease ABC subunit UvrC [Thermoplasmata archaeon]|nr:excinuclease ABC subunit UvrC [Thermoplasmata archaeon]